MNDRVEAIRSRVLRSRQLGDPRENHLRADSFSHTQGEPEVVRCAKATAHVYRHQQVIINDRELIVGARPGLSVDTDGAIVQGVFGRREFVPPAAPFWPVPVETHAFWEEGMLAPAGNHTTLDYGSIFSEGFLGLLRRVDKRMAAVSDEEAGAAAKRDFLMALKIVGEGFLDLSSRYADAAENEAKNTPDGQRRGELEAIARNCRRVPANPPETFWEACQCAWFAFFFLPDAPGRVDQYLWPCYRRDTDAGTLSRRFAKELLSCLWLKYFEHVGATSGISAHNHLTLGGVEADGSDAANAVTELCLEVTEDVRVQRPQVGLRCHSGTSPDLVRRAVKVLRSRTANPDFCNDDQIVPALTRIGVGVEDARDFSLSGCHEVIVTGKAQMGSVEGFINLPKILRMALGLEPALQTGVDPAGIGSPEALWDALCDSMARVAEAAHVCAVGRDRAAAQLPGGNLQASLVVQDCISNCRGYTQGGARYNFCNWDVIGVANLADSLVAIRRVVFEEQAVSLAELGELLARDWAGAEPLRLRALSGSGHFGNDEAGVDEVASRIVGTFSAIMKRHTPFRGGEYILGTTAGGENMHIEFGRVTGATPDGRRSGDPLADSLGAAQGRDRRGVTALLNSVAALPHQLLPTATTLNVRLSPSVLETETGIANVAALIQSHFRAGGQQMQFNLVSREMLLQARRQPEQHGDLMVRVAGYCAPFTSLWEDLQDEIMARAEHEVGR